jgi:hypothetical protein
VRRRADICQVRRALAKSKAILGSGHNWGLRPVAAPGSKAYGIHVILVAFVSTDGR